jgi:putative hydroxymethylpyrimidine transport system substrate-binding protein
MRVTFDSYTGAENVGFLMADERGYFRDAGLHVWVGPPGNPELPASYVASGQDDVGLVPQPQAVTGELGEPIVVIGSVISEPTEAIIWLRGSGVENVADLKGKVIGTTGVPFQAGFLEQALTNEGLSADDAIVLPAGYEMVSKLLQGEVDAIFGGSANIEGKALEARGAKPVVTPVQELGIPAYDELVVIARSRCVARDPAMYRRFMAAVKRGTKAAVEDPRGAARLIKESLEGDPEATPAETKVQLEATLPLLSRSNRIDLAEAADLVEWMQERDLIEEGPPVSQLFTNDFLTP